MRDAWHDIADILAYGCVFAKSLEFAFIKRFRILNVPRKDTTHTELGR